MAEALLRHVAGDRFEAESAGFEPGVLNPLVVATLREIGIDISNARTKSVFDLYKQDRIYQYVITVCDESSSERCPIFRGMVHERLHWSFKDPSSFQGSPEEKLAQTRLVLNELQRKVEEFAKTIPADAKQSSETRFG